MLYGERVAAPLAAAFAAHLTTTSAVGLLAYHHRQAASLEFFQHAAKHSLRLERLESASGDPPRLLGRDGEATASLREAVAETRWAALEAAEACERVARPWSEEHGPLIQIFRLTRSAEDLTPAW